MKNTRVATIIFNLETKKYEIQMKTPYTSDRVKEILQKLLRNNLKPTKG